MNELIYFSWWITHFILK